MADTRLVDAQLGTNFYMALAVFCECDFCLGVKSLYPLDQGPELEAVDGLGEHLVDLGSFGHRAASLAVAQKRDG